MAISFELDTRLGGRAFPCLEHSGGLGSLKLFLEVREVVEDGPYVLVGKQPCGGVASVGHFHHAGLGKQGALDFAAGVIGGANSRPAGNYVVQVASQIYDLMGCHARPF